jgi:TRAP-type uncharacterized transport system fused permease subunit
LLQQSQLFGHYFSSGMHLQFPFIFNFGMFKGLPARAIHLGFALTLAFLIYPFAKGKKISVFDILISFVGAFSCFYIYFLL